MKRQKMKFSGEILIRFSKMNPSLVNIINGFKAYGKSTKEFHFHKTKESICLEILKIN